MKALVIAVFLTLLASVSRSAALEEWECRDIYGASKILAKATVDDGGKTGAISVAGVTHKTAYAVNGFERRWDFGLRNDGSYTYAFIVRPDGAATYFDFGSSKTAKPSIFMQCKQK